MADPSKEDAWVYVDVGIRITLEEAYRRLAAEPHRQGKTKEPEHVDSP